MSLEKKTAFITGGAEGLGQGFVQKFLEEGANVFFGDINEELGKAVTQELQQKYGKDRVRFFPFDVTNGANFQEAFDAAVLHYGNIDIFINNAGILHEGMWEKMIEINFMAMVRGSKIAMEHMRKDKGGKGGRIINISSLLGLKTSYTSSVYCGTKQAVRSFTTCMAETPGLESNMGIEFALLCPDAVKTSLTTQLDDDRLKDYSRFKDIGKARTMPVSMVVDSLFSLLKRKDSINGAILMVLKTGASFQKMESIDLGSEWPIPT